MTKRLLILFSAMAIFLGASAYDFAVDGIMYNKTSDTTVELVNGKDKSGIVTIPANFSLDGNTYTVTSIGQKAFDNCSGLKKITIPNTVTRIGSFAFNDCSNLNEINIPNSVTTIGSAAFQSCKSLTSINIPNSVVYIDDFAFNICSGLTELTIPLSVKSIGASAFNYCSKLSSITCFVSDPSSITLHRNYYNEGVFYGVPKESCKLYVPKGSIDLYSTAQQWQDFMNIVEFDPYTRVGINYTYTDNSHNSYKVSGFTYQLPEEVLIPTEHNGLPVTSIGEWAFEGCSSLTTITIPNTVSTIEKEAFRMCSNLTEVNLPNSLTSIGEDAFWGCGGIKSMNIPESVTSIGPGTFTLCTSLNSFNGKFSSTDNRCLIIDGTLVSFAPGGLTTYDIPNLVTSIDKYAFYECTEITSIKMPNSLISIGYAAFAYCYELSSIIFSEEITTIEDYAFIDCRNLSSLTIPESLTYIGFSAFKGCNGLTILTIPESVTYIGQSAFDGCSGLTSITIPSKEITIKDRAFSKCSNLNAIYGGLASEDNRCLIKDGKLISFAPKSLTEYTIPESVISIGEYVFMDCSNLLSITIPNSVTLIGNGAFYDCIGLTSINIPNSVKTIEYSALYGCIGITSLTCLVENPTQITVREKVFSSVHTSTCTLYVPKGSKALYEVADQWKDFANIEELESPYTVVGLLYEYTDNTHTAYLVSGYTADLPADVKIPPTYNGLPVVEIGPRAFSGCSSMASIVIPNSIIS